MANFKRSIGMFSTVKAISVISAVFSALFVTSAMADPVSPPSKDDEMLITNAIQVQLSDASVVARNMRAALDPASPGVEWVCGEATLSGGSDQHSFLALVSDDALSETKRVQHLRIAKNATEEHATKDMCERSFTFARDVDAAGPEIARNMSSYASLEMLCLMEGRPSSSCSKLDDTLSALRSSGWCRQEGVVSWRQCDAAG